MPEILLKFPKIDVLNHRSIEQCITQHRGGILPQLAQLDSSPLSRINS